MKIIVEKIRKINFIYNKRTKIYISLFKISFTIFFIIIIIFINEGCCQPQEISILPLKLIPQHRDWWCWAASTEMISDYYGHKITQHQSVNFIHGSIENGCLSCSGDCSCWGVQWGAEINDLKNNWDHWNFNFSYSELALSWVQIKTLLSQRSYCSKSPIQAIWWYWNGGGHIVVIYGYKEINNNKYIYYLNPAPEDCIKVNGICTPQNGGEEMITTYEAFISNNIYNWKDSFYEFILSQR